MFFLDNITKNSEKIKECLFETPHWQPDHYETLIDGCIAFSSTQRFITPECSHAPMPYQHRESGCIVIADVRLTNRKDLCQSLHCDLDMADVELIMHAYLKWKEDCTRYLSGDFMFAIWNAKRHELFVATDHFGSRPCLYAYEPGRYFFFANEMSSFPVLCSLLRLNQDLVDGYILDNIPPDATRYQEIKKLQPAHQLLITPAKLLNKCYWELRDQIHAAPCRKREDYYEYFLFIVEQAINNATRSHYPLTTHISGGLDSSSITCLVAKRQEEKNQSLYAFTAIPNGLDGESYRSGWYYHEMPRVSAVLNQYKNIHHHAYIQPISTDIHAKLSELHPYLDQPIRNVFNFGWVMGSLDYARSHNGRVVITGSHGNAGLSWPGISLKNRLGYLRNYLKNIILSKRFADQQFKYCHEYMNRSRLAKRQFTTLSNRLNPHYDRLNATFTSSRHSSFREMCLWYGIDLIDPTLDLELIVFCYNLPEWVYFKGNKVLQKRLLVREALTAIVPDEIRNNPYRGEQSADWFLQSNHHVSDWCKKMQSIHPAAQKALSKSVDPQKIQCLITRFLNPIQTNNVKMMQFDGMFLSRYMSAGFFLDYLARNGCVFI